MSEGRVGRYELLERIARGGMAEVWRARADDGTIVCVKRLDPSLKGDVDFIEMFRDEASLVLDFDHPNVVRVSELIDDGDELAMVMELVDGPSLAKVRSALEQGKGPTASAFGVDEALQIGISLCRALHHAHTRTRHGEPLGIVHRDVSPQNILLSKDGAVKLVDFGIAKAAQRLTRTRAGALKGKCSYMAPEQVRGDRVDHRADQFAAGIVLWEMLTGRRLFSGRNEVLILEQVARSDAVPPSTVKKGIPRSVDRAVLRALGWHRDERFADMNAFAQALQDCLDEIVAEDAPGGVAKDVVVDLRSLVERSARVATQTESGALRTRVLANASTEEGKAMGPGRDAARDTVLEAPFSDPLALPERTGQFFERKKPSRSGGVWLGALGVAVVGVGVGAAVWIAERETAPPPPPPPAPLPLIASLADAQTHLASLSTLAPSCDEPCLTPFRAADASIVTLVDTARFDVCLARCGLLGAGRFEPPPIDSLEAQLRPLEGHACRTELLEDLLDAREMSVLGRAALADSVAQCAADASKGARLRQKVSLDAPAWPKKKKRTGAVTHARAIELAKRGRLAGTLGDYERAKALLVEAVDLEPRRVELHERIGVSLRGLGDAVGAGHHFRLYFHAFPDDTDKERVALYLKRYKQDIELVPSANPGTDERTVRVHRLLERAALLPPAEALPLLDEARTLLPEDPDVLERIAGLYASVGRTPDAKAAYEAALKIRPSKKLRARLRALEPASL